MCKGRMIVTTGPTVEPVTLQEALQHCHGDTGVEDSYIEDILIPAARQRAEEYQNRAFLQQTVKLIFDSWPVGQIVFPYSPVLAVSSVKYYDTASAEYTLATTNFDIDLASDPARMVLKYGHDYPSTILREQSAVEITYSAGYGTTAASVPAKIKLAILFLVGIWYNDRGVMNEPPEAFYNILRPTRLRT